MSERSGSPAKPYVWWPTFTVGLVLLAFGGAATRGTMPLVGLLIALVGLSMAAYAMFRRAADRAARGA